MYRDDKSRVEVKNERRKVIFLQDKRNQRRKSAAIESNGSN